MSEQLPAALLALLDQTYTARERALDQLLGQVRAAIAVPAPDAGPELLVATIIEWLLRQPARFLPALTAHALLRLVRSKPTVDGGS